MLAFLKVGKHFSSRTCHDVYGLAVKHVLGIFCWYSKNLANSVCIINFAKRTDYDIFVTFAYFNKVKKFSCVNGPAVVCRIFHIWVGDNLSCSFCIKNMRIFALWNRTKYAQHVRRYYCRSWVAVERIQRCADLFPTVVLAAAGWRRAIDITRRKSSLDS